MRKILKIKSRFFALLRMTR